MQASSLASSVHPDHRTPPLVHLQFLRIFRAPLAVRHVACLLLVVGNLSTTDQARAQQSDRPEFSTIARVVEGYFESLPGHQPADLVSRSHVEKALELVEDIGWELPDRQAVVDRTLSDGSFLVRELATPAGQKFMRNLSSTPGAYCRLDRLSTISGGKQVIHDLIRTKGGYEMIEYMATTKGGHNLGRMMAGTKNGVDLNKPTGRIYTAKDLLAVLKTVYLESTP